MRIGYLVPEFPAQTHNFFWEERKALQARGIETLLISTRRPKTTLVSHTWAQSAQSQTTYLAEISIGEAFGLIIDLVKIGPAGWLSLFGAALSGCPPRQIPYNLALILPALKLVNLMRDAKLCHVHSHSCAGAALIAALANRLDAVRYSLTLHGDLEDYGTQQEIKFRYADFAIAITKRLRRQIREVLKKDAPMRIGLAPMGVETEVFKREGPYVPWSGKGSLRLFSCGRLNFVKGHQDLISAVGLLRATGIEAVLEIAGEDDSGGAGYRKVLETQVSNLCLEEAVRFLGAVPVSRVLTGLASSHLFVLASHHEPLGVALMEAMSYGTPVISTNRGGVPELIDHLSNGYLVSPRDPEVLAHAIKLVALDHAMAMRFSDAGRRTIVAQFRSNASAIELERMLMRKDELSQEN